jgi:hypothetical protein
MSELSWRQAGGDPPLVSVAANNDDPQGLTRRAVTVSFDLQLSCARSSSGQESLQSGGECRVLAIQPETIREPSACGFANRRLSAVMRSLGFESQLRSGLKSSGLLSRRHGFESRRACCKTAPY